MISDTAEYALRALVHLARPHAGPQTVGDIARGTGVPAGYLAKILQTMTRNRLVASQRGMHGGFTLAREPERITALDVVRIIDPPLRMGQCPLRSERHPDLCPLHRFLDNATAALESTLGRLTLAGLNGDPANLPLVARTPQPLRSG